MNWRIGYHNWWLVVRPVGWSRHPALNEISSGWASLCQNSELPQVLQNPYSTPLAGLNQRRAAPSLIETRSVGAPLAAQ